jgi:hypothetical protein
MAATATAGYTLLNEFVAEMLQYCNGAPSIMLRIHLINSAIDLCNKALLLKKTPSALQLEEDVHTYTLKYPQDRYRAIAVDSAKLSNSQPLQRITEREMDSSFSNWRETSNSKPTHYWLTDELNKIRVWPTPTADIDDEDFTVQSIVTYKRGQIEVDEFIYEKWHEVIQAGALSKVLAIPEATWYSAEISAMFGQVFSRGVREARKTTLTGTGKYAGRVMPQSFVIVGSDNVRSGGVTWE